MFKPSKGAACGVLSLLGLLALPASPASAQARDLDLLEVYEIAAAMVSRQNPLFLFPGLQADRMTVNGNGGEYHVVINGFGLPGSTATVPEPMLIRLPQIATDGDLIEVTVDGLPTSTIMPGGQSLKLIDPRFRGEWSIERKGFERFELSVNRIAFQGAGIAYTANDLSARLSQQGEKHVLAFDLGGFKAEYGDSFTGTERAKRLRLALSAPRETVSAQALLALAYRLSGFALNEPEEQAALAPPAPRVSTLDGLSIELIFDGEEWEQVVPPSSGRFGRVTANVQVEPGASPGLSRVSVDASLKSFEQRLEQIDVRINKPSTFSLVIDGLESQSLADLFLDRQDGFEEPQLGQAVGLQGAIDIGRVAVLMPAIDLDFSADGLAGRIDSVPDAEGAQSLDLVGQAAQVKVSNWANREQLEPLATNIIIPGLPTEAQIGFGVEGLSAADVQGLLSAALALDLGGVAAAFPTDLTALELVLQDSFYRSKLVDAEWSGRLRPRAGRIPVQGTLELVTGPLAPMQIGMQQSIATPVPAVSQSMSAGILGLTLLQTFATREDGGRLRFEMTFPEEGGLPLVNGRPLPFQQFIR